MYTISNTVSGFGTEKTPITIAVTGFLLWSMGYKKDFFAGFAFEFEPLQNDISLRDMIYGWRRMIYFHFVKI